MASMCENCAGRAVSRFSPFLRAGLRTGLMIAGTVFFAACSRPTGDFDRAAPSVVHDEILPLIGQEAARGRKEPVSKFNLTNDEEVLRDRGWTLIRPPATQDWIEGSRVELERTRILPESDQQLDPSRYYAFLATDRYRSSDARYERVAVDALGDADLVLPFCEVAERVGAADEERLRALGRRSITTQEELEGAQARVWENQRFIDWTMLSLRYRLKSYRYAIDALEIETPSQSKVWDANTAWKKLAAEIVLLEKGCEGIKHYDRQLEAKRSRIYTGWGLESPAPKK